MFRRFDNREAPAAFHLVVANGQSDVGGGIRNDGGRVHLTDCVLQNNVANGTNATLPFVPLPALGGAIYNRGGSIVLDRTLVTNNSTLGWNGRSFTSTFALAK